MNILKMVQEQEQYVINTRQYLHKNPELSMKEKETSAFVQKELDAIGIPYEVVDYGVIGLIEGQNTDQMLILRADMDALAIIENNPHLAYMSQKEGVMHACGHDAHTAMLLGAAKILNNIKSDLKGSVLLCFQQAEETGEGAVKLLKTLEAYPIKGCFGIHVSSKLESGKIAIGSGPTQAASDTFTVTVKGSGGHGSRPDLCRDPLLACSAMTLDIARARATEMNPFQPVTISVGSLHVGSQDNIIADSGYFIGTIRSFTKESREEAITMLHRVTNSIAEAHRVTANVVISNSTKVVYNDPQCALLCKETAKKIVEDSAIETLGLSLGAEDFSEFTEKYPGIFINIGTKNELLSTHYPHHHPKFNIDESPLKLGVAMHIQYTIDFLNSLSHQ